MAGEETLHWTIKNITDALEAIFQMGIPTMQGLPSPILAMGGQSRPGLNSKKIAADVIAQFPKIGIENGDNVWEKYTVLLVQTIIDAIVYDARISIANKPGDDGIIQCNGGNSGGPVVAVGTNMGFGSATGVIS